MLKESRCEYADSVSDLQNRINDTIEEMANQDYGIEKMKLTESEDKIICCMLFERK